MPHSLKQIVAAYVPSKASDIGLSLARDFADKYDARLTVINVNPEKSKPGAVEKGLVKVLGEDKSSYGFVEKSGKPYREILALEKAMNADLIVMGSHGSKERDPNWIGGNAFKVISGSDCPVLVFPDHYHGGGFKKIVLPLTDSRETRQKVTIAVGVAKHFGATIHALVIHKEDDPQVLHKLKIYGEQVQKYCDSQEVECVIDEINGKQIAVACMDYAKEIEADLICIMSERETPLSYFLGHYAQQLVNESEIPVLTVHVRDYQLVGEAGY